MLKVKKKILSTKNKNEDVTQLHEETKNYIKIYILAIKKRKKQLMNTSKLYQKLEMNMIYYKKIIIS